MGEHAHEPVKAASVVLEPDWTMHEALRVFVRGGLDQLGANAGRAMRSRNVEFLHQARVALRRMRSALKLLQPAAEAVVVLQAELGWLAGELGPARNWDVLIEETLPPIFREYAKGEGAADAETTRLLNAARRRRAQARAIAKAAIASKRYAALARSLQGWLAARNPPTAPQAALTQLAARKLRKRHKRLLREAEGLLQQTPEQRHGVRLDTKRLRYAVEFFGSLFARRAVKEYLRELEQLQDALGELNDAVVAARLLEGLTGAAGLAQFTRGWLASREAASLALAGAALARLSRCKRFWKSAA